MLNYREYQNISSPATKFKNPKYGQYNMTNLNEVIDFGVDQPNNLNLPIKWFQETCLKLSQENFCSNENEHSDFLQHGAIDGYYELKNEIAEWLSEKYYHNLSVSKKLKINHKILPSQLFMTNGNTGALHLIMSKYTESADKIFIDNPTNSTVLKMLKEYGLDVEAINMEKDGTDLEDLENKITNANSNTKYKQNVLFYYMIPTYHNPTGITMTHNKRIKLAELCDKYDNLYIISDESYQFISWSDAIDFYPMADYHPKIISLGSFSKILAPALRVGWIYQNTKLLNYDDSYGFIHGETSLANSAVLNSSGGVNPIGFKFIEYALKNIEGTRPIDSIILNHVNYLKQNCQLMTEYLQQYSNIEFTEPSGGYFIWIKFKTIKNTAEFAKYCIKNKISICPGNNFSLDNSYTSSGRLSFSYYNSNELIIGLERLMDCVHKYNCVNIMINGSTGNIGSLIKKEVLQNSDMNYVGDIKRDLNSSTFNDLVPFNSVIVDISSNEGTSNLLSCLVTNKIYIPLIIGTSELDSDTMKLITEYSQHTKVVRVTNFSRGIPLIREFAKISNCLDVDWKFNLTDCDYINKSDFPSQTAKSIINEISRNVNVETSKVSKVIGEHTLELSNGSETLTITHTVADRNTFVKGCIKYMYWILTKSNGFYNIIEPTSQYSCEKIASQNIVVYELENNLPSGVINKIIKNILINKSETTKISFLRFVDDDKFSIDIYSKTNDSENEMKLSGFCGYSILSSIKYILDAYDTKEGDVVFENINYKYKQNDTHFMIQLPNVSYMSSKEQDEEISELISRVTNLTLFGISRYSFGSDKYIIMEIKENIMESEFLDTICAIISSDLPNNSGNKILFINTSYYTDINKNQIYLRCYDICSGLEISDNAIGCVSAMEYYMYHFIKSYKENKSAEIHLVNNQIVNVLYSGNIVYLYEKKN
jgi:2-aminoadipate transaminase